MKYAFSNSRKTVKWTNGEISWDKLGELLRNTKRTPETIEAYRKMTKAQQADIKDVGGFVGGHLKKGIRKKGCVLCRSMLVLDLDYCGPQVWENILSKLPYRCFCYSTHKHTPEHPRLRLIIVFTHEVSEEEYPAIARMVAKEIGIDMFDDCTYEANRLMYWPSTSINGEYFFREKDGTDLDPDAYLAKYDDWHDTSTWPVSSREGAVKDHGKSQQADPFTKTGLIGAFCRAYPISVLIPELMSDIYAETAEPNRYSYIPADSAAGAVAYDDKFLYSHHTSDPACRQQLNSFDLYRVHKFRELDLDVPEDTQANQLPSYRAMMEFANTCPRVKRLLLEERQAEARTDFASDTSQDDAGDDRWQEKLKYMARSKLLENSVYNLALIMTNDKRLANFGFNEMANAVQVTGKLPWSRPDNMTFWRDADTAHLKAWLDINYLPFSSRNHDVVFTGVADNRRFHPVRNYLDSLEPWDKKPRLETFFIERFMADDTRYVRLVSRKTFVAAVARIYRPGTKFDHILTLDGIQGIGKSTVWKVMAGIEYFSDALSLTDMEDKAGAEKLQGFWIVEIGELAGMKRAEIERVKSFITTTDDKYRPSYGRVVESHPRQCIMVATVNGENGYLRDITGNRRFWVVKCRQTEQKVRWEITPELRDQIWAEAKYYYEQGEDLNLPDDVLQEAEEAQIGAMEVDERQGLVEQYLARPLPTNWATMDLYQRRSYLDGDELTANTVTEPRKTVSNAEIWCECFGKNLADMKPSDSFAIAALMMQIDGWKRSGRRVSQPLYGRQRVYEFAG